MTKAIGTSGLVDLPRVEASVPYLEKLGAFVDKQMRSVARPTEVGRVAEARGTIIKVMGVDAAIGEQCVLEDAGGKTRLLAEVVGIEGDLLLLTPLGEVRGISLNAGVRRLAGAAHVRVCPQMVGRVLNAFGQPIDHGGVLPPGAGWPLHASAPDPMQRPPLGTILPTGVRAIDAALSVAQGQRMGVFAVAGAGKSTLLGMLARGSTAQVNVIALIGERGREVREFMHDCLGEEGMRRSVVVVATSDRPPLERMRAAFTATAIAEYFRSQGKQVLFLCDSATRFARACRDVGLAAGEPPTRRGYPPSVFSALPSLFERTGADHKGSITAFYTVLVEDEDVADPIAEEVRSLLDGHIELSRKLAGEGQFPAIDILSSVSRVMNRVASPEHTEKATKLRQLLSKYREIEMLLQMGEYKAGADPVADHAIRAWPALKAFLGQTHTERIALRDTLLALSQVLQ